MSEDIHTVKKIETIMKFIPSVAEFGRMLDISHPAFEYIVGPKPVFPYSQEDATMMHKEEYKMKFAHWEGDVRIWEKNGYDKFRRWNLYCLTETDADRELHHLQWLCNRIANKKVCNMDMEFVDPFQTAGIYFDKNRNLVVYNGR